MILSSPLKVWRGKTKPRKAKQWFILNLNNYRNAHYLVLNRTNAMANQIQLLPVIDYPITIHYEIFAKTRRSLDIDNVVSVHKKYFQDALVEMGRIEDDDFNWIVGSSESYGGVDKENPRVEITITKAKI